MTDNIGVAGTVCITLFDEHGNIKETRNVRNLIVEDGREYIASRMTGTAMGVMSHMAVGSGGGIPPATGQSALTSELANGRRALTSSNLTGTPPTNVQYIATFPSGAAGSVVVGSISEAGILNSASGGVMLCRTTFTPVVKAAADTVTITWNVSINAA